MIFQAVLQGKFVLVSESMIGYPWCKWDDLVYVGDVQRNNLFLGRVYPIFEIALARVVIAIHVLMESDI